MKHPCANMLRLKKLILYNPIEPFDTGVHLIVRIRCLCIVVTSLPFLKLDNEINFRKWLSGNGCALISGLLALEE
jgi:hypothetical protein